MTTALTRVRLIETAALLAMRDKDLARILTDNGTPPLWSRRPGFATLIRIILEQQVSLVSAAATYRRITDNLAPLSSQRILAAGVPVLRSLGVTRQKASYCINVAEAIRTGDLDFQEIAGSDDKTAIEKLTRIKGIGPWTARIYLLMALRRPDVWPVGDIALATAVQNLKRLGERPDSAELANIAGAWRPYRATAARMLWQYYLKG